MGSSRWFERMLGGPLLAAAALTFPAQAVEAPQDPDAAIEGADATAPDANPAEPAGKAEPAREKNSGSASRLVEEIIVTAQKREEKVQDVPIAIAAFSSEQLDALGAADTKDLALITPGLQFTELAGYTLIFLRGVGSDAFIPSADPSVATYVDGIFVPTGHGFANTFGGVERVEVAKGPQGTLFGRNSTGGAISVILKEPGGEPETSIQTSYASFDEFRARVYSNIPLSDSFGFSIAALLSTSEPLYERVNQPGKSLFREEARGARLKLHWQALDNLSASLTGQYITQSGAGSLISAVKTPSPLLQAAQVGAEPKNYETSIDTTPAVDTLHRSIYGNIKLDLPWFDLKVLGSDQLILSRTAQYDFDASARPLVSFNSPNQYTDQQTGEFQILSNAETWGSDWFRWVAGLYYLDSVAGYDPVILSLAESAFSLPTGEVVSVIPPALLGFLNAVPGPEGIDVFIEGLLGTKSTSAYFQGTVTLTDWLDLTFGGRYQEETRRLVKSSVGTRSLDGSLTQPIQFPLDRAQVSNFSPKLSFDMRLWDEGLVYLSWQKGFKSATYNIVNIYAPPDYVKPEEVTAIELGVKSTLLDGALRLNGAIFETRIKDLQSTFVSLLAGGAVNFENAGRARIRGAEFDLLWAVMPQTNPGLVLTGGSAYLDAVYTSFENGSGFDETTGLYFESRDFTGNLIPRTPEWSGNVGLSQTIELVGGPLEIAADYYYNSGFYYTAQNSSVSEEDSYDLINARVSYLYTPWELRLTVFGNNLADSRYSYAQFHTDFGVANTLAPPVTYGVRLNWDF